MALGVAPIPLAAGFGRPRASGCLAAFGLVGGAWALAGVDLAASSTLALLVRETRTGRLAG